MRLSLWCALGPRRLAALIGRDSGALPHCNPANPCVRETQGAR